MIFRYSLSYYRCTPCEVGGMDTEHTWPRCWLCGRPATPVMVHAHLRFPSDPDPPISIAAMLMCLYLHATFKEVNAVGAKR